MEEHGIKHPRNVDLPIYPRAFISAAKLHRETGRVFVAMPFEAPHSKVLWRVLQNICEIHELKAGRGDSSQCSRPIVADILAELESAEIIIADLTGLNPNVLYELGIAHARCDSVILLCERGQGLPFDLASIRCLFYDLSTVDGKEELSHNLARMLEALRQAGRPTIIKGGIERTRSIVSDLKILADLPDDELCSENILISGFLSSFAISEAERFSDEESEYRVALLEERDLLLKLGRRGCSIQCIITPPGKDDLITDRLEYALHRLKALIGFLESGDSALSNVDWVISPYRQKNIYIIGHVCVSEGFKTGLERGYPLTLRQSDPGAIDSSSRLHRTLFEQLRNYTLLKYRPPRSIADERSALRLAILSCLKQSLKYCKQVFEKGVTTAPTRSHSLARAASAGRRSR